jgi:methanogenic corrinoid protein MtbC1
MGVALTQFKFEKLNNSFEKNSTLGSLDAKLKLEFGSSPRLVGGTSFVRQKVLDEDQVKLLTQAAIQGMDETRKVLMKWRRHGQSLADIYIHGITKSARLIGELWTSDELDFVNINIAFSRLHRALHEFSTEFLAEGRSESNGLSLLLMTEPGSHHGMGAFMLSEFFRQAGWRVSLVAPQDIADFKRMFLSDWFDAVVLSISTDRHIDTVSQAVHELQKASANPRVKIYVGGPMACRVPHALDWAGTLLMDKDAAQTVEIVTQTARASTPYFDAGLRPTRSHTTHESQVNVQQN